MDSQKVLNKQSDKFLRDMVFHGASSAAMMIYKNGKISYYKSTSYNWQDFYSNAQEANKCHIAQQGIELISSNCKSFSIIWDATQPTNDESVYLNEQREKFDHCHGISICEALPGNNLFGIILTGRRADINFADLVIKNKHRWSTELKNLKLLGLKHNTFTF